MKDFLNRMGFIYDDKYKSNASSTFWQKKIYKSITSGNEKQSSIYIKENYKKYQATNILLLLKWKFGVIRKTSSNFM